MGEQKMFRYLSPDGYDLLGKAAALKFLVDKEYPDEEVQQIRDTMRYEGWWSDPGLPRDWLHRMGSSGQVFLITSTGEHLVRMEAALDWVRGRGDIKEIRTLETFVRKARAQGYH